MSDAASLISTFLSVHVSLIHLVLWEGRRWLCLYIKRWSGQTGIKSFRFQCDNQGHKLVLMKQDSWGRCERGFTICIHEFWRVRAERICNKDKGKLNRGSDSSCRSDTRVTDFLVMRRLNPRGLSIGCCTAIYADYRCWCDLSESPWEAPDRVARFTDGRKCVSKMRPQEIQDKNRRPTPETSVQKSSVLGTQRDTQEFT